MLSFKNVSKVYHTPAGRVKVLENTSFELHPGETMAVMGQSGSGKSTLLHLAGLLDTADKGEVKVKSWPAHQLNDREAARIRNQTFGFVYQQHHLLREFTALENVMMPAQINGKSEAGCRSRAMDLLAAVKLTHRMAHFPSQLSGGERQRVAIARALMNEPAVLLADEPTGNLDPQTAEEVTALFFKLVEENNMALLMVTHNPALAKRCQKTYALLDGQLS